MSGSRMAEGRAGMALRHRLDAVRWTMAAALMPRRRVDARGLSFTVQYDNPMTRFRWQTCNTKEPETLDWVDGALGDGDVLFDIGANIGVYSLYGVLRHPGLRVIAFEPEYANLHLLRDNIVLNGLHGRVEAYALAVGDRCGPSRLHVQDLTPGAALHTEAAGAPDRTEAGEVVVFREGVWVVTLDDFCRQAGVWPTAVKIDVDGGEERVLRGAQRTLASPALRTVLVEVGPEDGANAGCARLLGAAGLRRADGARRYRSGNQVWTRGGAA
jgi:FkbM family methyltransferase